MSKISGRDLTQFKKQWFTIDNVPEMNITRSASTLIINQPVEGFQLDTQVWILDRENQWSKKDVALNPGDNYVELGDLAGRPLLVDPEARLLATQSYRLGYTSADWLSLYQHAPNAAQKTRLLDMAYTGLKAQDKDLLMESETNVTLRRRMIRDAGPENVETLLAFSQSSNVQLREAAFGGLGRAGKDPRALKALTSAWSAETHPAVKATLLKSLLSNTEDDTLASQAWRMDHYKEEFRKQALAWFAQHRPEKAREMALNTLESPPSEPVRVEAIRVLGRLKDLPGDRRVFEALAKVTQERSFGARTAAVNALADYGDPLGISYLRKIEDHSLHYMRRSVRAAIQRLAR